MLFGFLGSHRELSFRLFLLLKAKLDSLDRDTIDLAPVTDEYGADFFGRDFLPGHFPVGLSRVVVFDPQDKGHEVVHFQFVVHHRLVLRVVTVAEVVFDSRDSLVEDAASGFLNFNGELHVWVQELIGSFRVGFRVKQFDRVVVVEEFRE